MEIISPGPGLYFLLILFGVLFFITLNKMFKKIIVNRIKRLVTITIITVVILGVFLFIFLFVMAVGLQSQS